MSFRTGSRLRRQLQYSCGRPSCQYRPRPHADFRLNHRFDYRLNYRQNLRLVGIIIRKRKHGGEIHEPWKRRHDLPHSNQHECHPEDPRQRRRKHLHFLCTGGRSLRYPPRPESGQPEPWSASSGMYRREGKRRRGQLCISSMSSRRDESQQHGPMYMCRRGASHSRPLWRQNPDYRRRHRYHHTACRVGKSNWRTDNHAGYRSQQWYAIDDVGR
jgi:hypothetical protein